jgi:xylitol oxidase
MQRNWSGNVTFTAAAHHQPAHVDEVQAIVAAAAAAGRRVHATGSRHSFSSVAATDPDGEIVSMLGLDRVVAIDRDAMTVTVEAGIRYGELAAALHSEGLALHNLPSLPHITVAGAVATGTHGSGAANGNLATAVRAVELVTGDGSLLRLDPTDARLAGAVVGLGASGVVVRITLAVEPTFDIAQTIYRDLPFDVALERPDILDDLMRAAYSVSLFTDYQRGVFQQVWWKGRVGVDPPAPSSLLVALPSEVALHPIESVSAESCTQQLAVPGPWSDRLPHFRLGYAPSSGAELQSEFFVDRADGAAAITAVSHLADELAPVIQISEIRTVAADRLWLSGSYGRDTLALHFTWVPDEARVMAFLPRLEAALAPFEARPHWGKLTALPPSTIRGLYPRWSDFEALVHQLDPGGTLANPYLDHLRHT